MLFLSPLFLWALTFASIPVIIHLINRRRHQTIQWAAMQFLLKATRQSRGKRKLRNILILACRCLLLAGLIFAAARPVVSGLIGWGGGSIDTVVLLLDRSASMEIRAGEGLESRREIILGKVREAMDDLGNPRLVLIDSATLQPQEVPSPEVLTEISSTAPTDTAADIPAMINRAAEWLRDSTGKSEIWLASDLQATNWRPNDDGWAALRASMSGMPNSPRLRVLSMTGDADSNNSVRLISARRTGDQLQLDLEILRHGDRRSSISMPLDVHVNGVTTTDSLTMDGQSLRFQKSVQLPEDADSGYGWISIPGDGNPRDNVAFFAYGESLDRTTMVVSAPGEAADYLNLFAAPPGLDGFSAKPVRPENAIDELSSNLAAVIWAAPLPSGSDAKALEEFVTAGGQLMLLPPGTKSSDDFLGISWSSPQPAPVDKFFILDDWNHSDGLFRDGIDGTPLAGHRLKAIRRQIPEGDMISIAQWEDGEPALTRRIVGQGTIWCLGSLPDYTWSNLGDADLLLPAVQRMILAGADRFDQALQAEVGPGSARLGGESPQRIDSYGKPDLNNARHEAGIYNTGDRTLAINRPEIEDVPDILTREELEGLLDGTNYSMFDQTGQEDDEGLSRDVWRLFLIAAMLFLIAEAFLCLPKKNPTVVLPSRSGGTGQGQTGVATS
ncbi:MAG: BatA and WFA domain-containing protein [Akkermansiaceae bacterium]|nr:BatA and WFA domain-containing protein [Akkermansiaceae bacterium]